MLPYLFETTWCHRSHRHRSSLGCFSAEICRRKQSPSRYRFKLVWLTQFINVVITSLHLCTCTLQTSNILLRLYTQLRWVSTAPTAAVPAHGGVTLPPPKPASLSSPSSLSAHVPSLSLICNCTSLRICVYLCARSTASLTHIYPSK